jgi:hypothetical protein
MGWIADEKGREGGEENSDDWAGPAVGGLFIHCRAFVVLLFFCSASQNN